MSEKKENKDKALASAVSELSRGMKLVKCHKCGCMQGALEDFLESVVPQSGDDALKRQFKGWLNQMEPVAYSCLGCKHCYPAVALNALDDLGLEGESCATFEVKDSTWPSVPGEYFVLSSGPDNPVAVSTLASVGLASELARIKPDGLCLAGKTETENIGIDKVVKNIITNPNIRALVLAGSDPEGHLSGATLLNLWEKGVDEKMRVKGSPGRRPVLKNVSMQEVEAFRRQVEVVDLIGHDEAKIVSEKVKELAESLESACSCAKCEGEAPQIQISNTPIIKATKTEKAKLDKSGYFVIIPRAEKGDIAVEHYAYDNTLMRVIEGTDAKSIYSTIIENGWVSSLSHAAYVGKELEKAELSLKLGFHYVQDGA